MCRPLSRSDLEAQVIRSVPSVLLGKAMYRRDLEATQLLTMLHKEVRRPNSERGREKSVVSLTPGSKPCSALDGESGAA